MRKYVENFVAHLSDTAQKYEYLLFKCSVVNFAVRFVPSSAQCTRPIKKTNVSIILPVLHTTDKKIRVYSSRSNHSHSFV